MVVNPAESSFHLPFFIQKNTHFTTYKLFIYLTLIIRQKENMTRFCVNLTTNNPIQKNYKSA